LKPFLAACGVVLILLIASLQALTPEILQPDSAVPVHVAGRFRDARGFQQSAPGFYLVFDRRAHIVYGVDETRAWPIVHVGPEPGRVIGPTAFSLAADGSFAVADAPDNRDRIQVFDRAGFRTAGFLLAGRTRPRVTFNNVVISGIGSLQYDGSSILMALPETGVLFTEYSTTGAPGRTIGRLRATGHEHDRDVHLALNSGFPLTEPGGGFYFVFQAGEPVFRKFDRNGQLLFERRIQGLEIDDLISKLPGKWPRREDELPLVAPTIRAAAVDPRGNLWISFIVPYTYVFDPQGDKIRIVQFKAAGILAPESLAFGPTGHLLVTPGLYEFDVWRSTR
jgi:hypothetical protein